MNLTYEATKEKYEFDVANADFKVESLQKDLVDLNTKLDSLKLTSPISGRILEVTTAENSKVSADKVLFTVADLASSYISADIPVSSLSQVKTAQSVKITMFDSEYEGTVLSISPKADATASTVPMEVEFAERPEQIIPNASCLLDIEVGKKDDAASLPRDYYLASGESMYLYVIDDTGTYAVKTSARFGLIEGGFVEVIQGAKKGEKVIVSSYDEFMDKDRIKLSPGGGTKL